MPSMASTFAKHFKSWHIRLPADDVRRRRAGVVAEHGWLIQYCFGRDDEGEYLDYYAAHRMTSDSHTRVYDDGRVVELPCLYEGRLCSDDPAEDRRLESEYRRHNGDVAEMLVAKGFNRFTINMALHVGLGDAADED